MGCGCVWPAGHPDHELPDGTAPPRGRAAVRHPLLRSLQRPHQLQVGLLQMHPLWTEIRLLWAEICLWTDTLVMD